MTVAELIERLKHFSPEMRVVVDGYEGGYDDPQLVTEMVLLRDGQAAYPYMGKHETTFYKQDDPRMPIGAVECLVLEREN